MLRLLHISDLHLGWKPRFLGSLSAEREAERSSVLRQAVDIALHPRHAIDMVIIAGDLFDNHRPEAAVVEHVLRELNKLDKAGVRVITVPGNHDEITYHDSVYRTYAERWPGLLVREHAPSYIGNLQIREEEVHLYSLAYTGGLTRCDKALADLPRRECDGIHMGIFHGSLDWNSGERNLPLSSKELARANYHYTALGHFHRHSEHRLGQGVAAYCGATAARGFDDLGTGNVLCVQIDNNGVSTTHIPIKLRPQYPLDINLEDIENEQELYRVVSDKSNTAAIVRLQLIGSTCFPLNEESLSARFSELFYYVEVLDKTDTIAPHVIDELKREVSIRGAFVRRMLEHIHTAASAEDRSLYLKALNIGLRAYREV